MDFDNGAKVLEVNHQSFTEHSYHSGQLDVILSKQKRVNMFTL